MHPEIRHLRLSWTWLELCSICSWEGEMGISRG